MRILHVTKKYPDALGGDAVVVANLEKCQRRLGHDVSILTSNCDEIKSGQNVYKFGLKDTPADLDRITPKRLVSLIVLFFKAFTIIKTVRPDVIHTHSIDMAFFISFAARLYKVPIVHTFHITTFYDENQSILRRKFELLFAKGANPVIVTAPNNFDVRKLQDAGLPARLLANGIDLSFWHNIKTNDNTKSFSIISVGRLEEQKGYEYLIRAVSLLKKPYTLTIVGEGYLRGHLENLISELNLGNVVKLVGRKDMKETRTLLSCSEVAVIPSLYETTPLTLLEAWAVKLPVVMTRVGLYNGYLKKTSKAVSLVPIKNIEELAVSLSSMQNSKKLRSETSKCGYSEVQQYTWDNIVNTLHSYYREVLLPTLPKTTSLSGMAKASDTQINGKLSKGSFSLVMPCFNAANTLESAVKSIIRQDFVQYELILVNDGSTDSTQSIMHKLAIKYPQVKAVSLNQNSGAAAAMNFGVKHSSFDWLGIVDSDASMPQGWLNEANKIVKDGRNWQIFGGKYLHPQPAASSGYMQRVYYYAEANLYPSVDVVSNQSNNNEPSIAGGNFFFKRSLYDDLDGFDERVRAGYDRLFLFKAIDNGIEVLYSEGLNVGHPLYNYSSFLRFINRSMTFARWRNVIFSYNRTNFENAFKTAKIGMLLTIALLASIMLFFRSFAFVGACVAAGLLALVIIRTLQLNRVPFKYRLSLAGIDTLKRFLTLYIYIFQLKPKSLDWKKRN